MTISLTTVERRCFAVFFGAGEARMEQGAIRLAEGMELPATVMRRLIKLGLVTRHTVGKDKVVLRPSIAAAAAVDKARHVVSR